jgi:succinate dehydrogenase/fumarate reductase-like Fe-S protein
VRKVHAYALLAWHFFLHVLRKLFFVYRPGGIERVRDNFETEGIASLTARERQMIAKWQSCIGCGLCEAACADLSVIPDNRHMGPQLLAESALRDLTQAELAIPSAEALEACDRDELEQICPVDIPLCELAEFLHRLGEEAQSARK